MSLEAGAATRDISPSQPTQLSGYPHVRRVSTGVHDPLLASALYLRNGSAAVLLCALDLITFNSDVARRIRRNVARALNTDEACVLISCTHTHSAPVTMDYLPFRGDIAMPPPDPSYLGYVEKQIVAAAVEAKQNAHPAELAWTTADARGVGGNRHSPHGAADPEVGVLAVRGAGKLIAVAMIYGMHPTVLHEDSTLVSGDFPYFARLHVQEKLGKELVILYHTGPAGNQSPRYHVKGQTFAEAERLGRKLGASVLASLNGIHTASPHPSPDLSPEGKGIAAGITGIDPSNLASRSPRREEGGQPTPLTETSPSSRRGLQVKAITKTREDVSDGRSSLARAVSGRQSVCSPLGGEDKGEGCRSNALQFTNNPTLAGSLQSVNLKRRIFPSVADAEKLLTEYRATYDRLKAEGAERAKVRTAEVSVFGAEALLNLARAQQSGDLDRLLTRFRPFEVQVLRIGDACIAVLPGEFFAEYGLDLKKRAAAKSFVVTYANGELQGYIVTPEAAAAGGYEAASSMFGPQEGAKMVDTALQMIGRLVG
jgi:hypothetical protein